MYYVCMYVFYVCALVYIYVSCIFIYKDETDNDRYEILPSMINPFNPPSG